MGSVIRHAVWIAAGLFLCLGLPALVYLPGAERVDAVSGATMEVPDQPSGDFVVILNRNRHRALDQWDDFFSERDVDVIMEDLSCLTVSGDSAGLQLAQRFQARLAQNQMRLTSEDGLLVVSRAEAGLYDTVILSAELAEAYDYSAVCARPEALVLLVRGDAA